jgi:creatinine amidohydrolase
MVRAEFAFPEEILQAADEGHPAIFAVGIIEWHGAHLPVGLDGSIATEFASRLAEKVNGVLYPTQWNAMTALPHRVSSEIPSQLYMGLIDGWLESLLRVGFKKVLVVTGHYAQGHLIEWYRGALRALDRGLVVHVATPLEPLGKGDLLDHAGYWEAAQYLALFAEKARLDAYDASKSTKHTALLGNDPREATAEVGANIIEQALAAWEAWIRQDDESLRTHYADSEAAMSGYVERFYSGSWEDAIQKWWETKE